jgi:hypothetical protein
MAEKTDIDPSRSQIQTSGGAGVEIEGALFVDLGSGVGRGKERRTDEDASSLRHDFDFEIDEIVNEVHANSMKKTR